jgi:c-di-AMP phosphodiesterase-like protein
LVRMENMVQFIARSRKTGLNVREVAKALSGGGHSSAAAATLRGVSLEEARGKLERSLTKVWGGYFQRASLWPTPPSALKRISQFPRPWT